MTLSAATACSRRSLLAGAAATLALAASPLAARAAERRRFTRPLAAPSGPVAFRAHRNGDVIGSHTLRFTEDGERLTVDIEINLAVEFAFITLYRYHHTNRETWQAGRLVAIETRTDDNGDRFRVFGRAAGNAFEVDGSSGRLTLSGDIVPTSYWNEAIATRGEWLDTQSGKLARSTVKAQPEEIVDVAGTRVEANRYALSGDITCDLWFHQGEWVKLLFVGEDGSIIDYVRMA